MIETITKRTAHSRLTPAYSSSLRTCEATEKYAKVTRPVVAIPIDRIVAPRPYFFVEELRAGRAASSRGTASASRRPGRAWRAARRRSAWTSGSVPGGVAPVLDVAAAGHVQRAPERFAGNRDEQVALRAA